MIPNLSVVMATADDFDGTYFTIQAMRLFHDCSDVEFIVVDNKPATPAGKRLKGDINGGKFSTGTAGVRYIEMPEPEGTAAPRERAIREAKGKYVVCLDAHVMLKPGSLARLKEYFREHPETNDLLSGPLLHDSLNTWETHFNAVWRGEMWGIWGKAWAHEHGWHRMSAIEDNGKCRFIRMDAGNELVDVYIDSDAITTTTTPAPGKVDVPWAGHEAVLRAHGWRQLGEDDDIFEIPGMGCGLMAFRKDAWQGFNPDFRGFGGEELYIHEKFRRAGGKCLCLGFLKWLHRFGRPGGVPYHLSTEDKCRNYIIGHQELGLDLKPVEQHFVGRGKVNEKTWQRFLGEKTLGTVLEPTLESNYFAVETGSVHFKTHMPTLRELAAGMRVTEVTRYGETSVAVAAGLPSEHTVYVYPADLPQLARLKKVANFTKHVVEQPPEQINACDVLVYKTPHNHEKLAEDLKRYAPQVSRFIVLHDTKRNGTRLDNNRPGYIPQLKQFVEDHPQWFVARHTEADCGLTVLGCQAADKPAKDIVLWPKGYGPGTQMKQMLEGLGIKAGSQCSCRKAANWMDMLGVEGCREKREAIHKLVSENYEKWGWKEKLALFGAGALSILPGGIAWQLKDKTDPVGSMIDLAIDREAARLAGGPAVELAPEIAEPAAAEQPTTAA